MQHAYNHLPTLKNQTIKLKAKKLWMLPAIGVPVTYVSKIVINTKHKQKMNNNNNNNNRLTAFDPGQPG